MPPKVYLSLPKYDGDFRAMPALGQCAACTPDDFKALTRFMAGRE